MKLQKGDFFVIVAILALALSIWIFGMPKESGERVLIYENGELLHTLSLETPCEVEVSGLTVKIENKEAEVSAATCPDKVCEKSGKISKAGEIIVCVPNRVSVKISGDDEFDARVN